MNTYKLRCVVLEDEDDIREWLVGKLKQYPELEIVGEATTLDEAFHLIATQKPDAAFMDIQLIGGDAFTLLSRLKQNDLPIPYIVMATGYPEYVMTALNDYRRYVVQYLVKPFVENWKTKFRKAIDALMAAKMKDSLSKTTPAGQPEPISPNHTFIQDRGTFLRLNFDNIAYLESAGGGETIVVMDSENHQVDFTLNKLLGLLPEGNFIRISKSNIVNQKRVLRINRDDRTLEVRVGDKVKSVGIGDAYYNDLLKNLPLAKHQITSKNKTNTPVSDTEKSTLLERDIAHKIQDLEEKNNELQIERLKSEHLLKNILPDDVANELKNTGETTARHYDMVTVLFADIKDFTKISETLSPTELVREIDSIFRKFDEIITKHNVEKIKTIGDAYMCAGGLPNPDQDNPVRVVKAALEMQQFMSGWNAARSSVGKPNFEIRIGIHSGPVVAGVVGSKKFTYDIWGDTVNTASRVEENGQVGRVNLSYDTWKLVRSEFNCRFAGEIEAKNKGTMEIYVVS